MSRAKGEYLKLLNTATWRRLRFSQLDKEPFCEECKRKGVLTPAEDVHHIVAVESVGSKAEMERVCYDPRNLMSLCRRCHADIHRIMQSHSKRENERRQKNKAASFAAAAYGFSTGADF